MSDTNERYERWKKAHEDTGADDFSYLSALETKVEQLEEERSGLRYTAKGLLAANRQMANRIETLKAEVERLRDIIQNGIRAVEVDHDSPLASDLRGWLDEARAALVVRGDDL